MGPGKPEVGRPPHTASNGTNWMRYPDWCGERVAAHGRDNPAVKTAATLRGRLDHRLGRLRDGWFLQAIHGADAAQDGRF